MASKSIGKKPVEYGRIVTSSEKPVRYGKVKESSGKNVQYGTQTPHKGSTSFRGALAKFD